MALGQPRAVRAEHERDVRPRRPRQAEEIAEQRLAGGRWEQVVAADDLPNPLLGIVDDDGQVVGEGAVTAAQDEVVDHVGSLAAQPVGHRHLDALGA